MSGAADKFSARTILHVDMDAFFASVEELDHPALRGKPVLVGHAGPRGVISAASYAARVFGCRSAQPTSVALRLCPQAIIMPVRFARYRELSDQVFEIFDRYSPLVQPLSIDEAFLDLTGSERLLGDPVEVARRMKRDIFEQTQLRASIGVAPNKFLAKLASDLEKPDGLTVIRPGQIHQVLDPLAISKLWGVGPRTAERLNGIGVRTIGELRNLDPAVLRRRVGEEEAAHFHRLANGLDERAVVPDRVAKSIGQEQTFSENVEDLQRLRDELLQQCEEVSRRLRRKKLLARAVTVKIRFGDFQTITRRCTLAGPTDITGILWSAARDQFDRWVASGFHSVRLIGMSTSQIEPHEQSQMELFSDPAAERHRRLDGALDQISNRFGQGAIRRMGSSREDDR